jgi:hypothetical protein
MSPVVIEVLDSFIQPIHANAGTLKDAMDTSTSILIHHS